MSYSYPLTRPIIIVLCVACWLITACTSDAGTPTSVTAQDAGAEVPSRTAAPLPTNTTRPPTATREPATPTPTVAPPTETSLPPTATPIPPTPTSTPMPPSPTLTPIPPTPTPVPPSATPPPPTNTPVPPTQPPPPPGNVVISAIYYDGQVFRVESDEYAQITNSGGSPVDIGGWRLNAGDPGQDFIFPGGFVLQPGQSCRVYTNETHPDTCGFSFGRGSAIWNNGGDCGALFDSGGQIVSERCY